MAKQTMISLFSGAGGLDCGLIKAGFDGKLCVEINADARETLSRNFPKIALADQSDIHLLKSKDILKQAGIKKSQLDLLAGGPPCQPFSKSSYWVNSRDKRMDDPRASTLKEFMRVVNDTLPKVVLIENVTAISFSDKDDGLKYISAKFNQINSENNVNYKLVFNLVNAADYGVPQIRKRLFIVASRNGSAFVMPPPTHRSPDNSSNSRLPAYINCWDAIGDLDIDISPASQKIKGKWADLLPSIPEGHNYLWHTARMGGSPLFGWRTRYWSFLLKLAKNRPSWTITAKPGPAIGPFHWKSRYLSIQELARLQTFPDDYEFCGNDREQRVQIGNAVPPALAELFGLEIRRQFYSVQVRKKISLIPLSTDIPPAPERRKRVPEKYQSLIGDYKAHPGIGKGPGASKLPK